MPPARLEGWVPDASVFGEPEGFWTDVVPRWTERDGNGERLGYFSLGYRLRVKLEDRGGRAVVTGLHVEGHEVGVRWLIDQHLGYFFEVAAEDADLSPKWKARWPHNYDAPKTGAKRGRARPTDGELRAMLEEFREAEADPENRRSPWLLVANRHRYRNGQRPSRSTVYRWLAWAKELPEAKEES